MSFYYRFGVTGKRVFRVLEGWVRFLGEWGRIRAQQLTKFKNVLKGKGFFIRVEIFELLIM